ncbi:MAG: hypothetical protein ACLQAH_02250 [Limisphaerales bacterium]
MTTGQDTEEEIKKLSRTLVVLFNQGDDHGLPIPKQENPMKPNQLATLVLRLMGIYCLTVLIPMVELLNTVIFGAQHSSGGSQTVVVIITFLLTACWLAAGISLIVFSKPLGDRLTPKNAGDGSVTIVSFEQIQILAFAVAGVLIFAEALPQLLSYIFAFVYYLIQLKEKNPYPDTGWPFNRFGLLSAIGTFIKAALGLGLFFGAHGFANFWRSMRTFGTPKPPPA